LVTDRDGVVLLKSTWDDPLDIMFLFINAFS
jgi:hypothetical protein